MSLSALRRALQPRRLLWRNLLVSLVAVTAIVVGLLTMHSLTLEHGGGSSIVSSSTTGDHHDATMVADHSAVGTADSCGDPCAPGHSMTVMACVLALLISVLLVGAVRMITAGSPIRTRFTALVERAAALPLPAPPSLHALCISRT